MFRSLARASILDDIAHARQNRDKGEHEQLPPTHSNFIKAYIGYSEFRKVLLDDDGGNPSSSITLVSGGNAGDEAFEERVSKI